MSKRPVFAIMYDFDRTLSPRNMQEYAFISEIGMEADEFWKKCKEMAHSNSMDDILAYMYVMVEESKGKILITKKSLRDLGRDVQLFCGVKTWFKRVNAYADSIGIDVEHYIISSGLKEIIEGTSIADEFEEIYAASFCYDSHGVPCWPATAVNYTSKTQFLFRINKGVPDVTDNKTLNEYMPDEKRRIPFRNMVYIGDGLTDVPCMKLTKLNGGHSIAVYDGDRKTVDKLLLQKRVDYAISADYSEGSEMEKTVFNIADEVSRLAKNDKNEVHGVHECEEMLREIYCKKDRFSEHLVKWRDDALTDMYDHNAFFANGIPDKSEIVAAEKHQKDSNAGFLKIETHERLDKSVIEEFGFEEGVTLTMLLRDGHISRWKLNPDVAVKEIKQYDFESDILKTEHENYGAVFGDDFVARRTKRYCELARSDCGFHYFGAFLNGEIAGVCTTICHNGYVGIDDLVVNVKFRKQYVATTLMSYIINAVGLAAYLHADNDDTPKNMYENMGFEAIDTTYEYFKRL